MPEIVQLLIVGAGGFGREVAAYAAEAHAAGLLAFPPTGFLDDGAPDLHGCPLPVLGTIRDHQPRDGQRLILAIGDPAARARLAAQLSARGARFATLVHPRAYVAGNAVLGQGCIIAPFASVAPHAVLAEHVLVNTHAAIGHDCRLGEASTLSPHTVLNGWVRLDREVLLGSGAVVTPHAAIGARSRIAAAAVVYGDIGPDMLALGNPARCRSND
ncbi:MAG: NeuD/PglB/VioB family sugar acetyltransferase [Rhodospirillaceae bacterium]|nr:NeuD/PglB/VioB family sugar acetyltransferase [Rhodospirillales bacterium]